MPIAQLSDAVEIHWDERGDGPLVVIANQFFSESWVFEGLLSLLAEDHRVVTYDPRGTGRSSRQGPYEIEADARDLLGVVQAAGPPALVVGMGDGSNRAVHAAAARPDLIDAVVCAAGNPVGAAAVEGTEGLAGSESVLDALVSMMETDYRGALRTMIGTANPTFDEEAVRMRVNSTSENCPQEVAAERMRSWIADNALEPARAVGDRLWVLDSGGNPWFPIEVTRRSRALIPEAHIREVEDGALSRPDITVEVVRALTAAGAGRPERERAAPIRDPS
ncbi:MAG: alpha/beta fold hydrolase [Solirubrobacterales bacterium]